jgi:hypothetical protein
MQLFSYQKIVIIHDIFFRKCKKTSRSNFERSQNFCQITLEMSHNIPNMMNKENNLN